MGISAFWCRDSALGLCVHSPQPRYQGMLHFEITDGKGLFLLCSVLLQLLFGVLPDPSMGRWQGQFPWGWHSQAVSSSIRAAGDLMNHTAASRLCSPVLFSHASHSSPACWTPCSWAMWGIPGASTPHPCSCRLAAWTAAEQPAAASRLAGGRDPFFNFSRSLCAIPVGGTPARLSASRAELYFSINPSLHGSSGLCLSAQWSLDIPGGYLGTTQDQT